MKKILILCAVTLLAAVALIRNAMRPSEHYGEFSGAPAAAVSDLIARPQQFLEKTVLIEGEVREQCKTMGCHFFFVSGNQTLRVDLEKLTGSAPMREGRRARVEGRVMPFGDGYQLVATAVEFL